MAETGERGTVPTVMLRCPAWTGGERRLREGGSCLRHAAVRRTHAGLREGASVGKEWRRAFIIINVNFGVN